MSHMLVLRRFKLSFKFLITYITPEFFPLENIKFHAIIFDFNSFKLALQSR